MAASDAHNGRYLSSYLTEIHVSELVWLWIQHVCILEMDYIYSSVNGPVSWRDEWD